MSGISTVGSTDALSQYGVKPKVSQDGSELGKNEFMELMLAQLNHQDPMKPQDNGAFISQLAQFSSLEEMQQMSSSVTGVATQFRSTQALQASAMVGRSVVVPSDTANLAMGGQVKGFVELPAATGSLRLDVLNSAGEIVQQIDMGTQDAGNVPFNWNGKDAGGNLLPAGKYQIRAQGSFSSGSESLPTLVGANVDSVSLGRNGSVTLNLAGMGAVALGDVRQIN